MEVDERSIAAVTRALAEDAAYRADLTARLRARTVDGETMDRLIAFARSRQATMGQAMARRVLTDAGISWEAL
jgi:hypothetical protein